MDGVKDFPQTLLLCSQSGLSLDVGSKDGRKKMDTRH
jgi:hypothetical protein